jgi:hypothetical protein
MGIFKWYVNTQINHYWNSENSHQLHEHLFHDIKTMWIQKHYSTIFNFLSTTWMKLGVFHKFMCAENENDKHNINTCADFVFYHMYVSSLQMAPCCSSSPLSKAWHYKHWSPAGPHRNVILNGKQDTNFVTLQCAHIVMVNYSNKRWKVRKNRQEKREG